MASSGGSFQKTTSRDFAEDAGFAFDYLYNHSEIDHSEIGVIGHCEGGMIAFMLASSQNEIAYILSCLIQHLCLAPSNVRYLH